MELKAQHTSNLLYLDGLRAIAALYVMLHHGVLQYYNGADLGKVHGLEKFFTYFFFQGRLAVDLFIVLSGFCLMLPILKNGYTLKGGTLLFYKKRVIRILPPYYLAMILSLVLIQFFIGDFSGYHWDYSIPVTGKDILTHIFLIYDLFLDSGSKINHVFWSIAVEFRIYMLFPLILFLWRRIGWLFTFVAAALFCCIITALLFLLNSYVGGLNLQPPGVNPYLLLFMFGMLSAYIAFGDFKHSIKKYELVTYFIVSLLLYYISFKISFKHSDNLFLSEIPDIIFGISCSLLLLISAKQNMFPLIQNFFSKKMLVMVGSFGYSLYLIHAPLIQVITLYIVEPLKLNRIYSVLLLLVLCLLIIIPLSYLFFLLCEKPFMKFGKKITFRQAEAISISNPAP